MILCIWCEYDSDGEVLGEPFCASNDTCAGDHMKSEVVTRDNDSAPTEADLGMFFINQL